MAALDAATTRKFVGQQEEISPKVAASDIYYRGAILCFDASGYAAVPSDAAAIFPAGVVSGQYEKGVRDYAYSVGASEYPRAVLYRGKVWLPLASAAQTDVGAYAYIADDNSLTLTAGLKTAVLVVLDVDVASGLALVDLRAAFVA